MGLVGAVLDFLRTTVDGEKVAEVKIDPGGGANVTAEQFGPCGDDSQPLKGDIAVTVSSAGREHVLGYVDPANEGQAGPGEKRLYSRDGNGAPIAVIWLKADGTIVVENGSGSLEMAPGGDVTINGVVIATDGSVSAPGEVTAMAEAAPVNLSTHVHSTAMGPSGAPTPGT